ncbi:MAG: PaaI family thioesterase [Myxococcota bacterium]
MEGPSLQERFAPTNACFGCGPANPRGLRIRSFPSDGELVADWTPEPHHEAFPGVLNGGIVGALLDCHSNWAAVWALMTRDGLERAPCCVTAEYAIKLRRPTPTGGPLRVRARAVKVEGDRCEVEGSLEAAGKVCATSRGVFVRVGPDHPAYHRW